MKKYYGLFLCIFFLFIAAGCSKEKAENSKSVPKESNGTHHRFLLFQEENYNEATSTSVGSLYMLTDKKKTLKIADGIPDAQYEYINSSDLVLFKTKENVLYKYKIGKEKIKLASDVMTFNGYEKTDLITYQNADNDLYFIIDGSTPIKISAGVTRYELIGRQIYYIDQNNDLFAYSSDQKKETKLASGVTDFQDLNGKDEIAYLTGDSSLFFNKNVGEENIKIKDQGSAAGAIIKAGTNLYYMNSDGESMNLNVSPIEEGGASEVFARNVEHYQFHEGTIYYVNRDLDLFRKKGKDSTAVKLAENVTEFKLWKDTIFYIDTNTNLFKQKAEQKPEKIGSSIFDYVLNSKGDIIYQTENRDLFINNRKISSDANYFSYYSGSIAFGTKNHQLVLMKDLKEEQVVDEDLSSYSWASYQNRPVYINEFTLMDISGVWMTEGQEGKMFFEISEDGVLTDLQSDEQVYLILKYDGYHSLYAVTAESNIELKLNKDKTLFYKNRDGITFPLVKSTHGEANINLQNKNNKSDTKEKAEVTKVLEEYIANFEKAVNDGAFTYIMYLIDPESAFYDEQAEYILDVYDKNIMEKIINYQIETPIKITDDIYHVTVLETYNITYGKEDRNELKTFRNTYTVKKSGAVWLITDIEVALSI